ncbi:MAG: hypothetical protein EOP05_03575 [Proteobacteria bacterium]|nr:MAG: hypothetical protein EOP05_03575 [Pseudomonadota bacterium]
MRKTPLLFILGLSAVSIVTMQNCGQFNPGSQGSGRSSSGVAPLVESPAGFPLRGESLLCSNRPRIDSGSKISRDEFISAYGRIGHTDGVAGFITKDGRLFKGSSLGLMAEQDAGVLYKWAHFDSVKPCGVTQAGRVRCRKTNSTVFEDVPELSGVDQVLSLTKYVCGLQNDGSIKCVDDLKVTKVIPILEPVILLSKYAFVGASMKLYAATSTVYSGTVTEWKTSPAQNPFHFSKRPISSDKSSVSFCDTEIAVTAFQANENNWSDNGCAISSTGLLLCLNSTYNSSSGPVAFSLDPFGAFTKELTSVDDQHRYLSLQTHEGSPLVCAIRRDLEVTCFTKGFAPALLEFERAHSPSVALKKPVLLNGSKDISRAIANAFKTCIKQAGEIICWQTPALEMATGRFYESYKLRPSSPLNQFAGLLRSQDSKSEYGRACGLDQSGTLVCEVERGGGPQDGTVGIMDADARYSTFSFFPSPSTGGCGVTFSGDLRCAQERASLRAPPIFVKVADGIAHSDGEFAMRTDGSWNTMANILRLGPSAFRTSTLRFLESFPDQPWIFKEASGEYYHFSSDGPAKLAVGALNKVSGLRSTGNNEYHDSTTARCPYLLRGEFFEPQCSARFFPPHVSKAANFDFISHSSRVYVETSGKVSSATGGSTELHYIPPVVIEPQ